MHGYFTWKRIIDKIPTLPTFHPKPKPQAADKNTATYSFCKSGDLAATAVKVIMSQQPNLWGWREKPWQECPQDSEGTGGLKRLRMAWFLCVAPLPPSLDSPPLSPKLPPWCLALMCSPWRRQLETYWFLHIIAYKHNEVSCCDHCAAEWKTVRHCALRVSYCSS